MKNHLITFILLVLSSNAFSKVWTITNINFTFSPDTLTINAGDTVKFEISSMHNAEEVSQSTWLENGTTPLPGFSLPGGTSFVLPSKLTAGIHYYVCTFHTSFKMKGVIIVKQALETEKLSSKPNISVYPNPSYGKLNISRANSLPMEIEIFNFLGERVYCSSSIEQNTIIELNAPPGFYVYKLKDNEKHISSGKITLQN